MHPSAQLREVVLMLSSEITETWLKWRFSGCPLVTFIQNGYVCSQNMHIPHIVQVIPTRWSTGDMQGSTALRVNGLGACCAKSLLRGKNKPNELRDFFQLCYVVISHIALKLLNKRGMKQRIPPFHMWNWLVYAEMRYKFELM